MNRKSDHPRWEVRQTRSMGDWEVCNPSTLEAVYFLDWAEALAYADRMARTREIVLPRKPLPLSLPGFKDDDPLVTVTCDEEGVILTDQNDGEAVGLYTQELRPLALALLAHAEQEGA